MRPNAHAGDRHVAVGSTVRLGWNPDEHGYAYVIADERSVHTVAGGDSTLAHVTRIEPLASGGVVIHSGDEGT